MKSKPGIYIALSLLILVAIGCNLFRVGAEIDEASETQDVATPGAQTTATETADPLEPTAEEPAAEQPGPPTEAAAVLDALPEDGTLLLNEIGFLPAAGEAAFVELKNGGRTAVSLVGARLENEAGQIVDLPPGPELLRPGEILLLLFDGAQDVNGNTVSLPLNDFVHSQAGRISLLDGVGSRLDWVAWGDGQPGAVRLGAGGVLPEPEPGFTIGRPPYSFVTSPQEWVYTVPEHASPGQPNRQPSVSILLPLSGASIPQRQARFSWYLVAGAVAYRVQIASDPDFNQVVLEETVQVPPLLPDELPPGEYFWRVAAVAVDGQPAAHSAPNVVTFVGEPSAWQEFFSFGRVAYAASGTVLNVPLLEQHKDTEMILLERDQDQGAHAWDVAHPGFDESDPSDNMNCVLASAAMINHYYGGDLSQDRIGFEVMQARLEGPEKDLNYGDGLTNAEITQSLTFALGNAPTVRRDPAANSNPTGAYNQLWSDVKSQIDQGKPVFGVYAHPDGRHAFVFVGYEEKPEGNFFVINDPWGGIQYTVSVNVSQSQKFLRSGAWDNYWILPDAVTPAANEPEIFMDSDFDDVVDFDEIQRFKTDPAGPDSDYDGIDDFTEIWTTGFDSAWGYSRYGELMGRDYDQDKIANELDKDSDEGGCWDGIEDRNRDGEFQEDEETYNYDEGDDLCFTVDGDWVFVDAWGTTVLKILGNFVVNEVDEIEGEGIMTFNHAGPCTTSSQTGPIEFGGEVEEGEILLEMIDNAEDEELDTTVSDELPAGCTLGEVLGESLAASFGPAAAMPAVIQLDLPEANEESSVNLSTPSALADRAPGALTITVKRVEPGAGSGSSS